MPNRWIKEAYCHSERIEAVCANARDLWVRLLVNADDHGLFDARPPIIASKCFPLNPIASKCEQLLDELERADLIRRYTVDGKPYLFVCRWYERPRSKPRFPEPTQELRDREVPIPQATVCNCSQLQALHDHDHDHDHDHENRLRTLPRPRPAKRPVRPQGQGTVQGSTVWEAYAAAYRDRYGTEPLRDVKVNAQLKQFVARVGEQDAPHIAAFFVRHNKAFYVSRQHAVGLLLTDAEGLRTQWLSGRTVTETEARQQDRKQNTVNAFAPLLAEAQAREANGKH